MGRKQENGDGRGLELRSGIPLFIQQSSALLKKNALLSWRNKRATFLQLVSSLFFIFLIFAVDQAIKAQTRNTTGFKNLFDPQPEEVTAIPPCEDGFFIKTDGIGCWDFFYTPTGNADIERIVSAMKRNNPLRVIPDNKVRGFPSIDEAETFLLQNPMRCPAAVHFDIRANNVIAYGIQTNSTAKQIRGIYENANFKFQIPVQAAVERELTRFLTNNANLAWNVFFTEFAHPNIETFSTVGTIGPTFLLAAAMFGFVIQMSNLVGEKENKLRQAMSTMGLMNSAYWLTWLLWELLLGIISSVLLVLFGMAFQFYFFLNNDFLVLFFMFFLFAVNMTGFAFLLSTFLSKATSATSVGFFIFVVGFLTQLVTAFGFPYDKQFSSGLRGLWSLFPPDLLAIGLKYLGDATATKQDAGISFKDIDKCSIGNDDCVLTMSQIYIWLAATFVVWLLLALYFDNVLPDANGVRKPWTYFLRPSYWAGSSSKATEGGGCCSCTQAAPPAPELGELDDEDVVAEEDLVKRQKRDIVDDPAVAVRIQGLRKTFAGKTELKCCCRIKSTKPYHAVKDVWYNIEKDKLFCLLGPNGAGKTTTINCLTGIIPTTNGDALIYGDSVRSTSGMAKIRGYMGVCPQFDILWEALSGREHLHLFGSIKGLRPADITSGTEQLLAQVKLLEAAKVRSGSYSGGMKRRLSVAIALIGDPKIVFLDEPTTGMDPVTRRHVWDIIESSKKGRAIVLTTHSMEEADILGDRIAIMARGRLRCIGTSIHLKTRFGAGYIVNVSVRKESVGNSPIMPASSPRGEELRRDEVKQFFKDQLGVEFKDETRAYITFVIPREKDRELTDFFNLLEEEKERLHISDVQISLTTLEEVFLNISKKAELESAAADGRFDVLTLTSGPAIGMCINVPVGAPFVAVPGTESSETPNGMMVEIYWQQDDTGSLCIAGHSDLMPSPAPSAARPARRSGSQRRSFGPVGSFGRSSRIMEAEVIQMSNIDGNRPGSRRMSMS
ncbi:ABC-2 type transport system permease protein [Marchantia polymorpha subsp. ruderalis]|nr:hypothetical protein MARPO_0165s0010 [Marchantia polymorpha]BBN17980.1 hypothetical protein Mp_7g18500 [Marchantia polymorpha subsp. ruderalis]|eukprot:PTQ28380.1 hypothetical protein MARPO_0165s0010 [Marchantia polymorpha]